MKRKRPSVWEMFDSWKQTFRAAAQRIRNLTRVIYYKTLHRKNNHASTNKRRKKAFLLGSNNRSPDWQHLLQWSPVAVFPQSDVLMETTSVFESSHFQTWDDSCRLDQQSVRFQPGWILYIKKSRSKPWWWWWILYIFLHHYRVDWQNDLLIIKDILNPYTTWRKYACSSHCSLYIS